ncbi:hypothetical protein PM082_000412 [Marasmius tenuissimus]|nr:hypothetical protein PM082_000412 [Marasmius tenuissimus]
MDLKRNDVAGAGRFAGEARGDDWRWGTTGGGGRLEALITGLESQRFGTSECLEPLDVFVEGSELVGEAWWPGARRPAGRLSQITFAAAPREVLKSRLCGPQAHPPSPTLQGSTVLYTTKTLSP